ncbi:DUF305 domain-containing protein [Paraburkholderia sp. D15]|uniref:CopM family metallochaperone n=1 Tax=Paraburkholderia sp. D15 TaxID=2880218 RepID=UPI002478E1E5|nr:DUF305 domain-containing protein [Paraburkholderia sp. D15]WGS54755.1 DUF305 domain-containing protein [Paraburkholderia sp. D15]
MKNQRVFRALCLSGGLALAVAMAPAHAQQSGTMPGMPGMRMPSATPASAADANASTGDSTQAFKAADDKMMQGMSAPAYTGNADRDFVAHMIPHHQGAVEMAQVELKYGKDPELKRLARNIIKAQRDEIAFMQRWQAKHNAQ